MPPGTGICHQVNLEYLGRVVMTEKPGNATVAYPDTLVGTDSHTTMISGIGILGFGVGGIEAEANLLGQPINLPWPVVVGVKLTGQLQPGATATGDHIRDAPGHHALVGMVVAAQHQRDTVAAEQRHH